MEGEAIEDIKQKKFAAREVREDGREAHEAHHVEEGRSGKTKGGCVGDGGWK